MRASVIFSGNFLVKTGTISSWESQNLGVSFRLDITPIEQYRARVFHKRGVESVDRNSCRAHDHDYVTHGREKNSNALPGGARPVLRSFKEETTNNRRYMIQVAEVNPFVPESFRGGEAEGCERRSEA